MWCRWASCSYIRSLLPLDQVPHFSRHHAEQWIGCSADKRPLSCLQLEQDEEGDGPPRLVDLYRQVVHRELYAQHKGCDHLLEAGAARVVERGMGSR